MKKFNLMIVAVWMMVYFCSLRVGPTSLEVLDNERFGLGYVMDITNYSINDVVGRECGWCVHPQEPVQTEVGTNADGTTMYAMQEDYNSYTDGRMTATMLRNTFPFVLAMMLAANFFFYVGRASGAGKIEPMLAAVGSFFRRVRSIRLWHRRRIEKSEPPASQEESLDSI